MATMTVSPSSASALFLLPQSFQADSVTRGVHFYNATGWMQGDRLRFNGVFDAAELVPVLLFSVGTPWIRPCVDNLCCLWEIAYRYKDADLLRALGNKSCDPGMDLRTVDLMKGSKISALQDGGGTAGASGLRQWDLVTRARPTFIIMLFLCLAPSFHMYYEILPVQWIERGSVSWSSSWYGERCNVMMYPDGREICIRCANVKPAHSTYVFSADWFQTFECRWVCDSGYAGPSCEIPIFPMLYACGAMLIVVVLAGVATFATSARIRRAASSVVFGGMKKAPPLLPEAGEALRSGHDPSAKEVQSDRPVGNPSAPPQRTPTTARQPSMNAPLARPEMISFKDSNSVGEIRIKFL